MVWYGVVMVFADPRCDMALIDPIHRNKPNISFWLWSISFSISWNFPLITQFAIHFASEPDIMPNGDLPFGVRPNAALK